LFDNFSQFQAQYAAFEAKFFIGIVFLRWSLVFLKLHMMHFSLVFCLFPPLAWMLFLITTVPNSNQFKLFN